MISLLFIISNSLCSSIFSIFSRSHRTIFLFPSEFRVTRYLPFELTANCVILEVWTWGKSLNRSFVRKFMGWIVFPLNNNRTRLSGIKTLESMVSDEPLALLLLLFSFRLCLLPTFDVCFWRFFLNFWAAAFLLRRSAFVLTLLTLLEMSQNPSKPSLQIPSNLGSSPTPTVKACWHPFSKQQTFW